MSDEYKPIDTTKIHIDGGDRFKLIDDSSGEYKYIGNTTLSRSGSTVTLEPGDKLMPVMIGPSRPKSYVNFEHLSEERAMLNHSGQSLARLAERGGMDLAEICANIYDKPVTEYLHINNESLLKAASKYIEY